MSVENLDRIPTDMIEDRVTGEKLSVTLGNVNAGLTDIAYNVKEYGATGTGSNNDTTAIQTVLDLAKTKGSVHCLIPDGVYWITNRLYLSPNTRITMGKNTVLLRKWAGGFFANVSATDSYPNYTAPGNIIIDGGILDGNWAVYGNTTKDANGNTVTKTIVPTHYSFDAIGLARAENFQFRNMTFLDNMGAHAFDVNAVKNLLIENCIFKGYQTDYTAWGDNVSYFREAVQISNHTLAGYSAGGIYDGNPCENVTVRKCYFGASDNLPAWPAGVGNHGSYWNKYNTNIRVYDNTFDGCTYYGIRNFCFRDMFVYDNEFVNCANGIACSNPDGTGDSTLDANGVQMGAQSAINFVISNNVFRNINGYFIYAAGWYTSQNGLNAKIDGMTVTGNIFDTSTNVSVNGFTFTMVNNLIFTNNTVKNAKRGMYLKLVSNATINLNRFIKVNDEAIVVYEDAVTVQGATKGIDISHNFFKDVDASAVHVYGYISGTTYTQIEDVRIEKNTCTNVGVVSNYYTFYLRYIKNLALVGNHARNCYGMVYYGYISGGAINDNYGADLSNEGIFSNQSDAQTISFNLDNNIELRRNRFIRTGRTGIYLQYTKGFVVSDNWLDTIATETDNTRNGIYIANSSSDGKVFNNRVIKAATGNMNMYGLNVSNTCTNVQTFNNDVDGKTAKSTNLSVGGFEGSYFHSADGTRYKVSVANGGTISIVAG